MEIYVHFQVPFDVGKCSVYVTCSITVYHYKYVLHYIFFYGPCTKIYCSVNREYTISTYHQSQVTLKMGSRPSKLVWLKYNSIWVITFCSCKIWPENSSWENPKASVTAESVTYCWWIYATVTESIAESISYFCWISATITESTRYSVLSVDVTITESLMSLIG